MNVIDVPVKGSDAVVTIDCSDLPTDPKDFCDLLLGEDADSRYWIRLAVEYRHIDLIHQAIDILQVGLRSGLIQRQGTQRFYFHSLLASLYLQQSRDASTGIGKQADGAAIETKEVWRQRALGALNEAARLRPLTATNAVTRGVLSILGFDKNHAYDEAQKQFDIALRENPQNLFAMLGKARILYSRKNFKLALVHYQKVLRLRPTMVPDPRIGIGLCYWQLDMKEDARGAWERTIELDGASVPAAVLLGLYYISAAFDNVTNEAVFAQSYAKGMKLVSDAYKVKPLALAGIALASYMFSRKKMDALHRILEKVLVSAEIPSLRAEAFFWIGRGQHAAEQFDQANSFYMLAKQTEADSLSAAMALGQMQLARHDVTDAKLTFESIVERHPKCIEALSILGSIYAQEALDPNFKGDKLTHRIKAKACLDRAINLTLEHKQRSLADADLHFTKAMLGDDDAPAQRLKTLEQAADIFSEHGLSDSPELLNNMAVVHHAEESYDLAREVYQKAIEACIQKNLQDTSSQADIQIATITYNLGRCEEQSGQQKAAQEIYTGLLQRYPDFVEPAARLAVMKYGTTGSESAVDSVKELLEIDSTNTEIRALYGWFLNRQRRSKVLHFNEDPERKHFNHTLKYVDNYERYSLVSLGNFYIRLARETRGDNDAGRSEKHKHYDMCIKFFERALHYDAKNAYAAQGLAIAFAEHKQYQKAINIFGKVRESLRDESIFVNMGHCLCELHQYSRAVENYETALNTFHAGKDLNLFLCLGRAWLSRGRDEKSVDCLREALKYAQKALELSPEDTSIAFNVAFVQFQFADVIRNTPELKRTVLDLEEAAAGLDEAIKTFTALAGHKQPPYPKADILQRATMGRNTTTRQLERAIGQQKEFELKNSAKVAEAKAKRDADRAARAAASEAVRSVELAKQEALVQKRKEMQEEARKWAERKRQEEEERLARDTEKAANKREKKVKTKKPTGEYESEEGEEASDAEPRKPRRKPKKKRRLRKSKDSKVQSGSDLDAAQSSDSGKEEVPDASQPAKKRKLSKKFISNEFIESDEDQDMQDAGDDETIGGQQYANEQMVGDRELDDAEQNEPNHTTDQSGIVPTEDDHAPITNQPNAQGKSILTQGNRDTLGEKEVPGIGTNGLDVV